MSESDWEIISPEWEKTTPSNWIENLEKIGGFGTGILQGISNLGQNIAQAPSDIYSYFSGKQGYTAAPGNLDLITPSSQGAQEAHAKGQFIAPFIAGAGTNLAVRGLPIALRMALGGTIGGGGAPSGDRLLGSALGTLGASDIPYTRGSAARELRQARRIGQERNIGNIPVPNQPINDLESLLDVQGLSGRAPSFRRLIEAARTGNYDDLFNLQSDIQKASTNLFASPFAHERGLARELAQIRRDYLNNMQTGLQNTGHPDIARLMREGQRRYREWHTTGIPIRTAVGALTLGNALPGWAKKLADSLRR